MATIEELKQKSGATAFASVLGKSSMEQGSREYQVTEQAVEILINNGYGIIHGGYAGGAMSAASDTANRLIREKGLPGELNIGVPHQVFDPDWERVSDASFVDAAEDIYVRLKVVTSGDIIVVCPKGGDGTELEETIVFHENVLSKKPKPLIFLQTSTGTNWRRLIETKMQVLDVSVREPSGYAWLYFIDSLKDFEDLIIKLKNVQ